MNRSTTIGLIDGSASDQRLEVALVQKESGVLDFVMSEQHFAEGIGWFTQRSMSLDPHQVAQLKRLLLASEMSRPDSRRSAEPAFPSTLKLVASRPMHDDQPLADVG